MKKNMGVADRLVRVIVAAVIALLYVNGTITGTLGLVLIILAAIMVLTSLLKFCPLYTPLGINTSKKKN